MTNPFVQKMGAFFSLLYKGELTEDEIQGIDEAIENHFLQGDQSPQWRIQFFDNIIHK